MSQPHTPGTTSDLYKVPFTVTIGVPDGTTVTVQYSPDLAVADLPVSIRQPSQSSDMFSLSEIVQVASGVLLAYYLERRHWPLETRPLPTADAITAARGRHARRG